MPSPRIHTVYKKKDGTRVPSVTTYLGVLAKPALIHWAWELGVQGLDYRKVRDQAGDIGTLVHYLILCQIKKETPDLSAYTPQDVACTAPPMNKFNEWLKGHKLKPILMEAPLVSEKYNFGGMPDFYGGVNRKLTLLDFKTSGAIYMETFCQLAAYRELLMEQGYAISQARIVRFGKNEDEGFEERDAGNLENHWRLFLACKQIYELQAQIRRTMKEID